MRAAKLAGSRPTDTRRTSQIDDIPQIIEEAANFYVSLLRDSRVTQVTRGPTGAAFVIKFELAGIQYIALNGGPMYKFNEAISHSVDSADQAEIGM